MTAGPFTQDPLGSLQTSAVVFTTKGVIISAADSFWHITGYDKPTAHLQDLDSLGAALLRIADSDTLLQGQFSYRGPEGSFLVTWRRGSYATEQVVLCCLMDEQPWLSGSLTPQSAELTAATNSSFLPDQQATCALLQQAMESCKKNSLPLSLARISVLGNNQQPLITVDHEAWCNIGRKLRGMCRVSDLVGVSDNGDFLVIAVNASLKDAQGITKRVLSQLEAWAPSNLGRSVLASAGYTTWTPGSAISPSELIFQAKPVGPKP